MTDNLCYCDKCDNPEVPFEEMYCKGMCLECFTCAVDEADMRRKEGLYDKIMGERYVKGD